MSVVLPPGSTLSPSQQTLRWTHRPLPFLEELRARHGDLFTIRLSGEDPWVVVSDPDLVEQVFTAAPDVLHAGDGNRIFTPFFGPSSLLVLDEAEHMRRRRLLLPSFHGNRMTRYGAVMRAAANAEIDRWPVDVAEPAWPRMHAIALETILRVVFGVTDPGRREQLRKGLGGLLQYSTRTTRQALLVLADPERMNDRRFTEFRGLLERAHALVVEEVARRRGDDPQRLEQRDDVLSLLLLARRDDGSVLSDSDLRDELMTLVMAGHETTATALSWTLERLMRHPGALRRTTEEAQDGGGPYTNAVIQETLRVRPVFPVVLRRVVQPFEIAGHTIPPGVTIAPSILLLHRRPDLYPEPDAFRPERFLERPPGTYTWIPFGGGVRRCLGGGFAMFQMRVVLATLLSRVRPRSTDPEDEGATRRLMTMSPSQGGRVVLDRLGSPASPAGGR